MEHKLKLLASLIDSAKEGNEVAVSLLRQIVKTAMDDAPAYGAITLAECLLHLGAEARQIELGRN